MRITGCNTFVNSPKELGTMKEALTKWGYVGGKINFIVCTYLMCIEARKDSWLLCFQQVS